MDEKKTLLLDSSYLLPIFGAKLDYRNFESNFVKLPGMYYVRYNPVSLIEAKWYVLKMSKRKREGSSALYEAYRTGLLALQNEDSNIESTVITNERIEEISDTLIEAIPDYFDRMVYSTAAYLKCVLLSEDSVLKNIFLKNQRASKPAKVLKWNDIQF
jgi:hypothetical protein